MPRSPRSPKKKRVPDVCLMYCVKCRNHVHATGCAVKKDRRLRSRLVGKCLICGTKTFRYI